MRRCQCQCFPLAPSQTASEQFKFLSVFFDNFLPLSGSEHSAIDIGSSNISGNQFMHPGPLSRSFRGSGFAIRSGILSMAVVCEFFQIQHIY